MWDWQIRRITLYDEWGDLAQAFAPEVSGGVPYMNVQGAFEDGSLLGSGITETPGRGATLDIPPFPAVRATPAHLLHSGDPNHSSTPIG